MSAALDGVRPSQEELEQAALLERELIERAREDLLAFTLYTFDGDYEVNWHHRVLADKLDAFVRGEIKRLIITMPPRHGKSELASRRLPAYILGRDPGAKLIACSYGLDLALDMSRDAKRVVASPAYQRVFPGTQLPSAHVVTDSRQPYKNTADQWQIVEYNGQYLARGVGGGITGKGGNFLIVDDPIKDDEEAQSETYRDKVWRWYTKVFKTRAQKGAGILVIMTRWHDDDLVGRLLERARQNPRADQWDLVKFEALRETEDNPDDPRVLGDALWPAFKDADELSALREEDEEGFAALYQQDPTPPGGRILKDTWMQKRWQVLPAGPGTWYQTWDPKHGSKDPKSSHVSGQLWFQPDADPASLYLVDAVRGLWGTDETIEEMLRLCTRPLWKLASAKLVEKKADGIAILNLLKSQVPGLIEVDPGGRDKAARVHAVKYFWRAGNIILPADDVRGVSEWLPHWIREHTKFPGYAWDDCVDASTQLISHVLISEDARVVSPLERIKRNMGWMGGKR